MLPVQHWKSHGWVVNNLLSQSFFDHFRMFADDVPNLRLDAHQHGRSRTAWKEETVNCVAVAVVALLFGVTVVV